MIAGLILAAGASRRFAGAETKLVADVAGRPLLQHVIDNACSVPRLERVIVVVGAHADIVLARTDLRRAEAVLCPRWADGIACSLARGLGEVPEADRVILLLGDQPLIATGCIGRFVDEPPGSRASFSGVPGHPAVLGPTEILRARALRGDRGLRDLAWRLVECDDAAAAVDVDTVADLDAVRRHAKSRDRTR